MKSILNRVAEMQNKGKAFIYQYIVLGGKLNRLDQIIMTTLLGMKRSKTETNITDLGKKLEIHYYECWKSIKKLQDLGLDLLEKGIVELYKKDGDEEYVLKTANEDLVKVGGRSIYVRITEVGESVLEEHTFIGEEDKSYTERLLMNIYKKDPKLIKKDVIKELLKK